MFELAAIAAALALLGVMGFLLMGAHGLVLANGQPLFGDFIAFWSAGRAALDGRAGEVHDIATIGAYHQLAAPGAAYVAPWNSPPTFLVIAAALAVLPYPIAASLFLAGSAALYLYAARRLLPDARAMIFAATLPAALYHLGTVQTGLVIAGTSALALLWLDKRPLAAGALVGALAIKPHLALLWPVLLALSGRWRAFAAAAASTLVFVALAGFVFGFDAYVRFIENLASSQSLISGQRITTPAYASLYASALGFGAPQWAAMGAHALSAASGLLVFVLTVIVGARSLAWNPEPKAATVDLGSGFSLREPRNDETGRRAAALRVQGAAMCAATLLMSPYLFFYDFTLLAVGVALLGAPRDRFELAAAILAWGAGLSLALGYLAPLPLCPLAAWLVLIAAFRRRGSAPSRPAPAPRT